MGASLIIAASEADSNLYYACRFLAPDPFVYLEVNGRRILLMSDLEVDRARAQARVDEVLSLSSWEAKARQRWPTPRLTDTVSLLLEDYGVSAVEAPADFPLEAADRLRERGVVITARSHPFFPERLIKATEEVAAIEQTQRHTERAFEAALDVAATFNYTPYLCTALLFVLLTIPMARLTDWLIARDRKRQLAGAA